MFCIQSQSRLVVMLYLCLDRVPLDSQARPIDCFPVVPGRRRRSQFEMLRLEAKSRRKSELTVFRRSHDSHAILLGSTMNPGKSLVDTSTEFRRRITHIRMMSTQPMSSVVELDHFKLQRKSFNSASFGSSHLISPSEHFSFKS